MITHIIALIFKNFYLWKRELKGTFCEIFTPLIFVFILYIFMSQSDNYEVSQTSYLNQAVTLTPGWDSSLISNGIYSTIKDCSDPKIGGKIGIAPNIPLTQKLSSILQEYPGIQVEFFDSQDQFVNHIKSSDYPFSNPPQICFGILFSSWTDGVYEYTLSYNLTESQDIPRKYRTDYIDFEQNDQFLKYINSGFTRIVNWIDNIILQQESGNPNIQIEPNITIMQTESYQKSNLYTYAGNFINIFIVIPMIVPYLRLSSRILHEKEKRIREGMMMMGLGKIAFYASWFITYLFVYAFISLLVSAGLKIYFFTTPDFEVIYVLHFAYGACLLAQSLFITVFFHKQRTGIIGATFLFLFQFLQTFNQGSPETLNNSAYQAQAFIVFNAITQAMRILVIYQSRNEHVNMDMLSQLCNRSKLIYSINSSWISFIVYFVLFLYLDQVISNEFGQRKHWLFFIGCKLNNKNQKKQQTKVCADQEAQSNVNETVDISLQNQEGQNKTIKIENLSKEFKTEGVLKRAVDQINLQMYSGQVFSFLGHNGAGKSTTISMLTGMIPPTSGTAYIKGLEITKDMDKIRSILGVCPQHDILFDSLTVKEHLYLFAVLKGIPFREISNAVEKIIKDVDLVEKTNSLSSSLSGGQKRKLSVAIAFIGESQVVLLDEPTSGMDVQARRHIWEMVKNYKQQKIIILTTHFMDEADYLGDRIGIISDGQVKCVGSSVFLKEKFGNGYNLTLVKEQNTTPSEPIVHFINHHFPESSLISDYSAEIAFQIPYKYIPQFEQMFNEIERLKHQLKIRSYGVSITTLEEVFLKVASMNDNHIVQPHKAQQKNQYQDIENQDDQKFIERITDPSLLFFTHFWALIKKRIHYFKRDKKGLCCELILPIILIAFGLYTAYASKFKDWKSYELNPTIFFDEKPKIYYGSSLPPSNYQSIINNFQKYDDTSFDQIQNVNSILSFDNSLLQDKTTEVKFGYYLQNTQGNNIQYTAFVNTVSLDGIPMSIHLMNNAIIKSVTGKQIQINVNNKPLAITASTKNLIGIVQGVNSVLFFSMGISFIPASIISFIVRERAEHIKHQQIVSGVTLKAYWISNFFIDYIKFLIPTISSYFLAYAYQIDSMTEDGNYIYFVILFIFYGLSLIPFTYLFSFLHSDYGNAQIIQFFIHFMIGGVGAVIVVILRFFDSTHSVGDIIAWVLRIFPSFAVYDGFNNIASRKFIQYQQNLNKEPPQVDFNVMGADLMFLILSFFLFTGMIIFIEKYRNRKSVFDSNIQDKYPYVKPNYVDSDVEEEISILQDSNPKDFTVLVRNLRKVFPPTGGSSTEKPKIAVDNLNFGVKTGDVFCFLGVNGAGKTTTMRMLTGEETIGSGDAYIQGCKIPEQISEAQQYIGYCPQFDALLDNLTAREHLELFAAIKGIRPDQREQAVNEKLDELNLRKFENVVARTYSGGNKRKLSVAIAMLGNPPIAFLDEPSTGMDPGNRRFMWNVISDMAANKKKTSIILTTHSMEEAEALGTKVGIVIGGNFKCMGSIQHLKNKFGKGYEISIKSNVPTIDQLQKMAGGLSLNTIIEKQNLCKMLDQIKYSQFNDQIKEGKFGSSIYFQLNSKKCNQVELAVLIESIYNFNTQQRIEQFLSQNFNRYEILEGLNNYIKVRVQCEQNLGYLFGIMNRYQNELNICSYTISQTTLEQIFHDIANHEIKTKIQDNNSNSINIERISNNQLQTSSINKQINFQDQIIQYPLLNNSFQPIQINHVQIHQFKQQKK
ncbi:ABC transporter family protein (macronuclear) [Tetrahymena thermophila SB210]|uniref:ABC transporter family protein n=1 Tax=Tetrahymena thermophila (strain SB210) TaxID=312017 RepID=W7XGR7_TETTS|nr:ABC transporter family protein [Tetrahymena thermophila SB210]EWS72164.1 ABC transporter family protein [Tetrahymena thermophila SB210]|eukprot:XP_012655295.1 ABC transporter family protein [Tetrahymena thermophila SB210]